jgi:hypothetical protein
MKEAAQYLFAIGVGIAGIGLTLLFQGLSLKYPQNVNKVGKWAYILGIIWIGMGAIPLLVGFLSLASLVS